MDRMIIELGSWDGHARIEVRFEDRRKPGQVIFLNRAGVTDLRGWLDGWLNEPQPVTVSIGAGRTYRAADGVTMGGDGACGGAGGYADADCGSHGGTGGSTDGGWNGAAGGGGGAG